MIIGGAAAIPVITTAAYCCARFLGLSVATARSAVLILSAGYGVSRLGGAIWRAAADSAGVPMPRWLVGADLFYKTPDFQAQQARLVEAGVLTPPGDAMDYQAMVRSLASLLDDCNFDYAVTFGRNRIDKALVETRRFSPPQSYGRLNLYVARGGPAKPPNPGTQPR